MMADVDAAQSQAIQDRYPDELNHCYGCGRLNDQGLHITSYWTGTEAICTYQPRPEQTAFPGIFSGGVIASIIDCHSLATASAAAGLAAGQTLADELPRFVTAALHVDFLKPTPLDGAVVIHAQAVEITARKVIVTSQLFSGTEECARGRVIAVRKQL